ncbi:MULTISPECIES: SA1362 family protein [Bacillaceae]|uniref:Uncharacterized protein n=1 Tax=Evansella alkalicola TaxID=745819 RepID=A0ABS6K012_9BACI|nr:MULTISPECIES: SA1362 family protein [Bacillaceae]MBU9724179.1 hypothetical protein [Bacillus alkalicola]
MFRHSYHPIVLTIIGLAVLGLLVNLVTRPGALITQLLVTIGIVVVMIFAFKRFIIPWLMKRQGASPGMHAQRAQVRKAPVSFSNKKKEKRKKTTRPLVKRQSNVKLTVIEGKKNKKKNRALF